MIHMSINEAKTQTQLRDQAGGVLQPSRGHYACFEPSGMVAPLSDLTCFSSSSTVMPVPPLRLAFARSASHRLAPDKLACCRLTP